ncbi:hypothetical protein ACFL6I_14370 [candidate division KSB1 bacterium]
MRLFASIFIVICIIAFLMLNGFVVNLGSAVKSKVQNTVSSIVEKLEKVKEDLTVRKSPAVFTNKNDTETEEDLNTYPREFVENYPAQFDELSEVNEKEIATPRDTRAESYNRLREVSTGEGTPVNPLLSLNPSIEGVKDLLFPGWSSDMHDAERQRAIGVARQLLAEIIGESKKKR